MYCTNCGAKLEVRSPLCPHCSSDPAVPMAEIDRKLAQLARAPIETGRPLVFRDPDEGLALGIAILLAAIACIVLSGLTLGLFLLFLLLIVVRVRITIASLVNNGVDVREMADARLHNLARLAYARLDMPYQRTVVVQSPDLNAFTMGLWDTGVVVLGSELVERLTPPELLFVLGHEIAHMRCRHTTWLTLSAPTRQTRVPIVSELLGLVFNSWSHKAEYSADRGGMLASRSLHAGVRALVRITTGQDVGESVDLKRYLSKAQRHSGLATVAEHMGDHPFLYNRVHALARTAGEPTWQRMLQSIGPVAPAGAS